MKLHEIAASEIDRGTAHEWARGWTNFPSPNHIPDEDTQKSLFNVLILRSNLKIYRGLSFIEKAEYDKFVSDTNNFTTYDTKLLSSWTTDKEYAIHFSMMDDEYEEDPYASVVIMSKSDRTKGFDLTKAEDTENEIVLLPGRYQISLVKQKIK